MIMSTSMSIHPSWDVSRLRDFYQIGRKHNIKDSTMLDKYDITQFVASTLNIVVLIFNMS